MDAPITEQLRDWHEFYTVLATAAATLIGAMFVVVSIAGGVMTEDKTAETRAFFTSTIVNLASVLLAGAIVMLPTLDRLAFAILIAGGGLFGLAYSAAQMPKLMQLSTIGLDDRFWYGGLPLAAYLLVLVSAGLLLAQRSPALDLLAFGLVLLLLAGIRNAWDLIVFLVQRRGGAG